MAAPTLNLLDDEVDQLLRDAELRLASKDAPEKSLVKVSKTSTAVTAVPANAEEDGEAKGTTKRPGSNLTVRQPYLEVKKTKETSEDAGPDWFNMPKTDLTPELKKDLQLLRMRSVLDAKQHFRKDTRQKLVPDYCVTGRIIEGPTEYYSARLTRKERKRTIVEEVLASQEANTKYKTRYDDIQTRKSSGKKGHYKKLVAARRKRR